MIQILTPDHHRRIEKGGFRVHRIHPGAALGVAGDEGFGGLGLIDDATLQPKHVVAMHEHRHDEIVSYLRAGTLRHVDSAGQAEVVQPDRLMVMNAGSGFSHEETAPGPGETRMLQIFVRPGEAGLPPKVQFVDLDAGGAGRRWRLLVGPEGSGAPAYVRQAVRLFEARLPAGETLQVPHASGFDTWLYVFSGSARVGDHRVAERHALFTTESEALPAVTAAADADLVLFQVDRSAASTRAGSLSGQA